VHRLHASSGSSTTRALARSPLLPQQQAGPAQALMRAHTDAINALAVIESPFRAIVAGDRSGVLRVWE
jgi:phosphoinositide-3-kinase regulatory subunit 4